jgi:protein-tyrosine phosphatase
VIDTHCHLLPGIDDGARTVGDAVAMARQLVQSGVVTVVCTPHLSTEFQASTGRVERELDRLRLALTDLSIELDLQLATEFSTTRVRNATQSELARRAVGGRFVLFELVPRTAHRESIAALEAVQSAGLDAIVAHPERSVEVQRDPALVDDLRERGALIQVVGPSLVGRAPSTVWKSAWGLLESGRADLVGSDAHRPNAPSLRLDLLADLIAQRCDRSTAERLFVDAPGRLLQSR